MPRSAGQMGVFDQPVHWSKNPLDHVPDAPIETYLKYAIVTRS